MLRAVARPPSPKPEVPPPATVVIIPAGNLYIADYYNSRIRKVDPTGIISTIAGTGSVGIAGDGGPATTAKINEPYGVFADGSGNIYIADGVNNRVRKITAGIITTVAGGGTSGLGDGGLATAAQINVTIDVATDAAGNLYISDGNNSRIRKVNSAGLITTIAGTGAAGYGGDGIPATTAEINHPGGVAIDGLGNIYIADWNNNRVRIIPVKGPDIVSSTVNNNDESLAVYPNPNNGVFSLKISSEISEEGYVVIRDVIGQTVKKFSIVTNNQAGVNINIPAGIYFLEAITAHSSLSEKIIIESNK